MTALYGMGSMRLPHVSIYKWAADKKIFLPADFRRTPSEEAMFLKLLAMRQYFVKLPPAEEQARYSEALKEAAKYLPGNGLSDGMVTLILIGGGIFFIVLTITEMRAKL